MEGAHQNLLGAKRGNNPTCGLFCLSSHRDRSRGLMLCFDRDGEAVTPHL